MAGSNSFTASTRTLRELLAASVGSAQSERRALFESLVRFLSFQSDAWEKGSGISTTHLRQLRSRFAMESRAGKRLRESFWIGVLQERGPEFLTDLEPAIDCLLKRFFVGLTPPQTEPAHRLVKFIKQLIVRNSDRTILGIAIAGLIMALAEEKLSEWPADPATRFGYRLNAFLCAIGASKKAQILYSYDHTPPAWMEGLGFSKGESQPLTPRETLREILAVASPELRSAFERGDVRLGRRAGSGAYVEVCQLIIVNPAQCRKELDFFKRIPMNGELAIHVVKPDDVESADRIFRFVLDLIASVPQGTLLGKLNLSALHPLINHYWKMLREETDFRRSVKKSEYQSDVAAEGSFEIAPSSAASGAVDMLGIRKLLARAKSATPSESKQKVRVLFSTASIYDVGERYRITTLLHGVHFHKLPTRTARQRSLKLAAAFASFIKFLGRALSKKPYDHDPHAANQLVTIAEAPHGWDILVALIDEHGYCEAPSIAELTVFGNMLMDGIGCALHRGIDFNYPIEAAFYGVCEQLQAGTAEEDVSGLLKTVVTITDFQKYIDGCVGKLAGGVAAYKGIMLCLAASGVVHPSLRKIFARRNRGLQLLLKRVKPENDEDLELLAAETVRSQTSYPPLPKGKFFDQLSNLFQLQVFDAVNAAIVDGEPGPFRMFVRK